MRQPSTAREALIAEAIGDVARLLDRLEAAGADMKASSQAMTQASDRLRGEQADFERRMVAFTDTLKVQVVRYMAVKGDEATRRSIDQQSRAMADAARVAFAAEVGGATQRLQAMLRTLLDLQARPWQRWLTHAMTAAAASAATLLLTLYLLAR